MNRATTAPYECDKPLHTMIVYNRDTGFADHVRRQPMSPSKCSQ
jgi:hypothetical protein